MTLPKPPDDGPGSKHLTQHHPLPPPGNIRPSYSEKLKTNVKFDQRLNRNILEITLERSDKDVFFDLNPECVAKLFSNLGIDIVNHLQGYSCKPTCISVWMASGIRLDRFCKEESIKVTNGIKTGLIRPAGRKEVTVSIKGLDFNTPDSFVFEYLGKFGKVVSQSVIYERYTDGPFKNKFNGERKFLVDFTSSEKSMGTFHIIDGSRVRIHYPGNKRTCARCFKVATECPGAALAKDCEQNGGVRIKLEDHMKELWDNINFRPSNFELNVDDDDLEAVANIKNNTKFSPILQRPSPHPDDIKKYQGISIKNFPKGTRRESIMEVLNENGLPEDFNSENVLVGDHGNVEITGLDTQSCLNIMKKTHYPECRKQFLNKPIYCRAVIEMNDSKDAIAAAVEAKENEEPKQITEPIVPDGAKALLTPLTKPNKINPTSTSDDEHYSDGEEDFNWSPVISPEENLALKQIRSKLFKDSAEESTQSEADDLSQKTPQNQFLKDKKRKNSDKSASKSGGRRKPKKNKQRAQ